MTIQNLFAADLSDILRVQLKCGHCRAQVFFDPDGRTEVSPKCPQCCETWKDSHLIDEEIVAVENFLQSLKRLRETPTKTDKSRRVSVRLAFDLGNTDQET